MTMPRRLLVREGKDAVYHCMMRCVRRAFLCGEDYYSGKNYDHRKEWVRSRLEKLARFFGVDVLAYAVMSNHLHVVVRTRPDRVASWEDEEVARRWLNVYMPRHADETREKPVYEVRQGDINQVLWEEGRVEELRGRLCNLSWFMRSLNEHIARRANKEEDLTGRFWEGRFKCQRLDDEVGIRMCMCYVDLNPVRAKLADSLEGYPFTSIYDRIVARKAEGRKAALANEMRRSKAEAQRLELEKRALSRDRDRAAFLAPLDRSEDSPFSRWTEEDYFRVIDWTGRQMRRDKPGVIDPEIRPLLELLEVDPEAWVETVRNYGRRFGLVVGTVESIRRAATALGRCWLKGCRSCEGAFLKPAAAPPGGG